MRRILIGDVGCGKTVCAAAAIYIALSSGRQAALMVPTTILAEQHYRDLAPLFTKLGYEVGLLTGGTKQSEKKRLLARLSESENPLPLVIGTHALLSDNVTFADLALTVTDDHEGGQLHATAALDGLRNALDGDDAFLKLGTVRFLLFLITRHIVSSLSRTSVRPRGRRRLQP